METKQSLVDIGNSFFTSSIEQFITNNPYMGFVLMSAMIEFLGKCYRMRKEFFEEGHSEEDFLFAINNLSALSKYRTLKIPKVKMSRKKKKRKKKISNKLYTALRCGMLHSLMPNNGIYLVPESTDIDNNIIGAVDLYNDLKEAWNEQHSKEPVKQFLSKPYMTVNNGVSGTTITQTSKQI